MGESCPLSTSGSHLSADDVPASGEPLDGPNGGASVLPSSWTQKGAAAGLSDSLSFLTPRRLVHPSRRLPGPRGSRGPSRPSRGSGGPSESGHWLSLATPAHLQARGPSLVIGGFMKDSKCVSINVFYLALRKTSCPLSYSWACAHTEDPTGIRGPGGLPFRAPFPARPAPYPRSHVPAPGGPVYTPSCSLSGDGVHCSAWGSVIPTLPSVG